MLGRPATTILLVTAQKLVRADFSRNKLLGLYQEPRPDFDDLPSLAEAALALGPKCGRKVWVLCSELWMQSLAMPTRTTAKLNDDDLARALSFELETLSGSNALESQVGQVGLASERPDERNFWVVQASTADRDMIDEMIRRAGGRFMGLAHPGGCPRPLSAAPVAHAAGSPGAAGTPGAWQRVELWPDVIVCLHAEPGQPVRVHLINADPRQERWHAEEESWRSRVGWAQRREMLLTTGELVSFDENNQPLVRQEEPLTLQALLSAWADALAGTPAVPLVKPAPRPLQPAAQGLIAAGIAVLVAGLCFGHYRFISQAALDEAQAEKQRLSLPVQQAAALTQQANALEREAAALDKELAGLKQTNEALKAQRYRLIQVLTKLTEHYPKDELMVRKIDGNIDRPSLHGWCLGENHANQLSTSLASALDGHWEVAETRVKLSEKLPNGMYEYTILLRMPSPPEKAAPVTLSRD